jgi:uncharacterized protein involved in response to NO
MQELSLPSQIILYVLLALMGLITLIVWGWQIQVLRGKEMKNPDGSADNWHEQRMFFGIAVADIFFACPLSVIGIVLVFLVPRWGYYLLTWVSCWFVWANIMTTATSLRFEKPKINLTWIIVFPFGSLVGLAYFAWTVFHFDLIF